MRKFTEPSDPKGEQFMENRPSLIAKAYQSEVCMLEEGT